MRLLFSIGMIILNIQSILAQQASITLINPSTASRTCLLESLTYQMTITLDSLAVTSIGGGTFTMQLEFPKEFSYKTSCLQSSIVKWNGVSASFTALSNSWPTFMISGITLAAGSPSTNTLSVYHSQCIQTALVSDSGNFTVSFPSKPIPSASYLQPFTQSLILLTNPSTTSLSTYSTGCLSFAIDHQCSFFPESLQLRLRSTGIAGDTNQVLWNPFQSYSGFTATVTHSGGSVSQQAVKESATSVVITNFGQIIRGVTGVSVQICNILSQPYTGIQTFFQVELVSSSTGESMRPPVGASKLYVTINNPSPFSLLKSDKSNLSVRVQTSLLLKFITGIVTNSSSLLKLTIPPLLSQANPSLNISKILLFPTLNSQLTTSASSVVAQPGGSSVITFPMPTIADLASSATTEYTLSLGSLMAPAFPGQESLALCIVPAAAPTTLMMQSSLLPTLIYSAGNFTLKAAIDITERGASSTITLTLDPDATRMLTSPDVVLTIALASGWNFSSVDTSKSSNLLPCTTSSTTTTLTLSPLNTTTPLAGTLPQLQLSLFGLNQISAQSIGQLSLTLSTQSSTILSTATTPTLYTHAPLTITIHSISLSPVEGMGIFTLDIGVRLNARVGEGTDGMIEIGESGVGPVNTKSCVMVNGERIEGSACEQMDGGIRVKNVFSPVLQPNQIVRISIPQVRFLSSTIPSPLLLKLSLSTPAVSTYSINICPNDCTECQSGNIKICTKCTEGKVEVDGHCKVSRTRWILAWIIRIGILSGVISGIGYFGLIVARDFRRGEKKYLPFNLAKCTLGVAFPIILTSGILQGYLLFNPLLSYSSLALLGLHYLISIAQIFLIIFKLDTHLPLPLLTLSLTLSSNILFGNLITVNSLGEVLLHHTLPSSPKPKYTYRMYSLLRNCTLVYSLIALTLLSTLMTLTYLSILPNSILAELPVFSLLTVLVFSFYIHYTYKGQSTPTKDLDHSSLHPLEASTVLLAHTFPQPVPTPTKPPSATQSPSPPLPSLPAIPFTINSTPLPYPPITAHSTPLQLIINSLCELIN